MAVRSAVVGVALVALGGLVPAPVSAQAPDAGALTLESEIDYPVFPCDPLGVDPCLGSMEGSFDGTAGGLDGGTTWLVQVEDAAFRVEELQYTTPAFLGGDTCRHEVTGADFVAPAAAADGTYGDEDVTGAELRGQLQYLRLDGRVVLAIGDLTVTLTLASGDVVPVPGDQWALGAGLWEIVEGTPAGCDGYDDPAAVAATMSGALTLTPRA